MSKQPTVSAEALEQLRTSLEAALSLARELADDPLLARIVAAFRAMPIDDRPVIISVLEREVTGRLLAKATEKAVGQSTHVNPNARLYVRAHDSQLDRRAFDRDEMMIADIRAMRIATAIRYIPELYAVWKEALREAMDHVDEPTRAVAAELLRDGLAAIADAPAADEAKANAEPELDPDAVEPSPDADERGRKS